jgi:hypothetical protein
MASLDLSQYLPPPDVWMLQRGFTFCVLPRTNKAKVWVAENLNLFPVRQSSHPEWAGVEIKIELLEPVARLMAFDGMIVELM